jgi:hypothetical protein
MSPELKPVWTDQACDTAEIAESSLKNIRSNLVIYSKGLRSPVKPWYGKYCYLTVKQICGKLVDPFVEKFQSLKQTFWLAYVPIYLEEWFWNQSK